MVNDDLFNIMMQRAIPPSGGKTHTPPQIERFNNAQQIQSAYANGWSPNPVLLQASLSKG